MSIDHNSAFRNRFRFYRMRIAKTSRALALAPAILLCPATSYAITCADLEGSYIFSAEVQPVYLGFFGNDIASESINNGLGTYGRKFGSLSVRNSFGTYGSQFSTLSANNSVATKPPQIYKYDPPNLIAYLTTNSFIEGGVSLAEIDATCRFFSAMCCLKSPPRSIEPSH